MSTRVLFCDVIPCDTPSSLAALVGPAEGVLTLPVAVDWGPDATVEPSTVDGLEKAYENLVGEGTSREQELFLNADLLRRVWPQLRLPTPCRDLWQTRFPELAAADASRAGAAARR